MTYSKVTAVKPEALSTKNNEVYWRTDSAGQPPAWWFHLLSLKPTVGSNGYHSQQQFVQTHRQMAGLWKPVWGTLDKLPLITVTNGIWESQVGILLLKATTAATNQDSCWRERTVEYQIHPGISSRKLQKPCPHYFELNDTQAFCFHWCAINYFKTRQLAWHVIIQTKMLMVHNMSVI